MQAVVATLVCESYKSRASGAHLAAEVVQILPNLLQWVMPYIKPYFWLVSNLKGSPCNHLRLKIVRQNIPTPPCLDVVILECTATSDYIFTCVTIFAHFSASSLWTAPAGQFLASAQFICLFHDPPTFSPSNLAFVVMSNPLRLSKLPVPNSVRRGHAHSTHPSSLMRKCQPCLADPVDSCQTHPQHPM